MLTAEERGELARIEARDIRKLELFRHVIGLYTKALYLPADGNETQRLNADIEDATRALHEAHQQANADVGYLLALVARLDGAEGG